MKKVTIGFSTSKRWKPFSALLKWWWGVDYSHVYIRWTTPWGFDEILEASGTQVRMVEQSIWAKKNQVIHEKEYELSREEFNRVMIELRAKTGTPYGYFQLVSIAICELFGMKKNPWGDENTTWICSELALKFLEIINKMPENAHYDRVSPYDIMQMVEL